MNKLRYVLLVVFALPTFVFPASAAAFDPFNREVCNQSQAGVDNSAVCKDKDLRDNDGNTQNPLFGPDGILTIIINLLSVIVGIVAVIIIIVAGLRFITSGNNPQDAANARERVIYACVALVIASLAQVLVRFIIGKI